MRVRSLLIIAAMALIWPLTPLFGASPEEVFVRDFLNTQPTIRIGITWAAGNGHQSAAATLVNRLRELGYAGKLQIVYANSTKPHQMEILFPGFSTAKDYSDGFQVLNRDQIEFYREDTFKNSPASEVDIGLFAANDVSALKPNFLRVKYLLTLQPLGWPSQHSIKFRDTIIDLNHLTDLGYIFNAPSRGSEGEVFKVDRFERDQLRTKLSQLAHLAKLPFVEKGAVYGHFLEKGRLLNYLLGLQWAVAHSPSAFKGGIVLPVFNDVNGKTVKDQVHNSAVLKDNVILADIFDHDVEFKLHNLNHGQILVFFVGPVPKPVFEYFFAESTLPPIVEGKNSANLMQLLGKPYLPTLDRELFHFCNSRDPGKSYVCISRVLGLVGHNAAMAMVGDLDNYNSSVIPAYIGQFILDAKDPNSKIFQAFKSSRASLDPVRHDKLIQGLLELIKVIDEDRSRQERHCREALEPVNQNRTVPDLDWALRNF